MPEPVLVAIAAALASKGVGSLYELVKQKLGNNPASAATLEAAEGQSPDSAEVAALSTELTIAEKDDPEFSAALRNLWQQTAPAQQAVANNMTGHISGKVVQAHNIDGDIKF